MTVEVLGECTVCAVPLCIIRATSPLANCPWVLTAVVICSLGSYSIFFMLETSCIHRPHVEHIVYAVPFVLIWAIVVIADWRQEGEIESVAAKGRIRWYEIGRDLVFMFIIASRSSPGVFKQFYEGDNTRRHIAQEECKRLMSTGTITMERLSQARLRVKITESKKGPTSKEVRKFVGKTGRICRPDRQSRSVNMISVNFCGDIQDIPTENIHSVDVPSMMPLLDQKKEDLISYKRKVLFVKIRNLITDRGLVRGLGYWFSYLYLATYIMELMAVSFPNTWGYASDKFGFYVIVIQYLIFLAYMLGRTFFFLRRKAHLWKLLTKELATNTKNSHNGLLAQKSVDQDIFAQKQLFCQVMEKVNVGRLIFCCPEFGHLLLSPRCRPLHNTFTKAITINALMQQGVAAVGDYADGIADLIKSCKAFEATRLKVLLDGGADIHTTYKLIYTDIADPDIRIGILTHFRQESAEVREQLKKATGASCAVGTKVLSDIDDTLYSSGGHFPAGCDKRFPHHMVYPGVLELYELVDTSDTYLDDNKPVVQDKSCTTNKVFLSARPHVYKDISEAVSHRLFGQLCADGKLLSHPTLVPGSLIPSAFGMFFDKCKGPASWRNAGMNKYTSFTNLADLYDEYDFVFFGDNGQGDLYAGQMMLEYMDKDNDAHWKKHHRSMLQAFAQYCGGHCDCYDEESTYVHETVHENIGEAHQCQLKAVCIHDVYKSTKRFGTLDKWEETDTDEELGLHDFNAVKSKLKSFHTYLGASVMLCQMGVLPRESLTGIAKSMMVDLKTMRGDAAEFIKRTKSEAKKTKERLEAVDEVDTLFKNDLASASKVDPEAGKLLATYDQQIQDVKQDISSSHSKDFSETESEYGDEDSSLIGQRR